MKEETIIKVKRLAAAGLLTSVLSTGGCSFSQNSLSTDDNVEDMVLIKK